jgi:hypothetical protein
VGHPSVDSSKRGFFFLKRRNRTITKNGAFLARLALGGLSFWPLSKSEKTGVTSPAPAGASEGTINK